MSGPGNEATTVRREVRVDKRDLRRAQVIEVESAPLPEGSARLALDLFVLSF